MARRPTAAREPLLAGLEGRLAPAPLPLPYALGLVVVSVAMVVLPLVHLALVAASAAALPALEQARVDGDALQGQGIAVDCLLGNQTNRMG
jgi:hypothetical protein